MENLAKGLKNAAIGTFAISGDALKTPKALSLPKFKDTKDGLVEAKQIVVGSLSRGFKEMDTGIKALQQAIGSSSKQQRTAPRNGGAAVVSSEDVAQQVPAAVELPLQQDDKANADEVRNWIKAWREKQQQDLPL